MCVLLCVSDRPSPLRSEGGLGETRAVESLKPATQDSVSRMSSRQERRKAERAAAKRAPSRAVASGSAGAAGAAGAAAAAAAFVNLNLLGDWTTQAEDGAVLHRAIGTQGLMPKAYVEGDREAQFSLGCLILHQARAKAPEEAAPGAVEVGWQSRLGGSSEPDVVVGLTLCTCTECFRSLSSSRCACFLYSKACWVARCVVCVRVRRLRARTGGAAVGAGARIPAR